MITTLHVIQEYLGEPLEESLIERLNTGPEDHLVEIVQKLSDAWSAWQDDRTSRVGTSVSHYFVGETHSGVNPLPLHKYLQLAMYFPVVAVPDPVEAGLGSQLQVAQLTGQILPSELREPLIAGLRRLQEIAPLVDKGVLELVPSLQLGMSQGVQQTARRELEANGAIGLPPDHADRQLASILAVATAICSTAKYWPLASSTTLWQHLVDAGSGLTDIANTRGDLAIEAAVTQFELPSAAKVPVDDLLRLRSQEDAFAEFRIAFGIGLREALDREAKHGAKYALEYLTDTLETRRQRCQQAARKTTALDGILLPGGSTLLTGAIGCALVDAVEGLKQLQEMGVSLVATGAVWILTVLIQEAMQRRRNRPAIAIYSALIES